MHITNWVSGKLKVTITSNLYPGGYELKTVQSVEINFDTRLDQINSLSEQRIGYLDRPTLITVNIGIIASKDDNANNDTVLDHNVMMKHGIAVINVSDSSPYDGLFTMTMSDTVNHTGLITFYGCAVTNSSPSTVVIEDTPQSVYNIVALDAQYTKFGSTDPSDSISAPGEPSRINF